MRYRLQKELLVSATRRFKMRVPPKGRSLARSRRVRGFSETLEQMRADRLATAARKRAGRETPTEIPSGKRLRTRKNSNWCSASFLRRRIHREWCCFLGLSATPAALRSAFAPARYSLRREKDRFAWLTWGSGCLRCMSTVACKMTED